MPHDGLKRSMSRVSPAQTPATPQNIELQVTDESFTVTDGNPGFGSVALFGLPEGNILILGAVAYIILSSSAAGITTTFDGDVSLGTAATEDGDVSDSNEANIIPSTALGAATAKVSPRVRAVSTSSGTIIDNTAGNVVVYLNVLIDNAAISADSVIIANAEITMCISVLGDD